MKRWLINRRSLALVVVLVPLLGIFLFVALRAGPLAPVPVTLATVENRHLAPALFGIGTVEARYTYRIGPTAAGRVQRLDVEVGDRVAAGQVLGEMDPVDLAERRRALRAALKSAEARVREAQARREFARDQERRYSELLTMRATSAELAAARRQELQVAEAGLTAAREDFARLRAEGEALEAQQQHLYLRAPVDGLVVAREAEPGTTVVAGQAVVELIDPHAIWVNVRFDQVHAGGLAARLPARIALRSQAGKSLAGRVLRVEPLADAVTEEILAKVVFDSRLDPPPSLGELAEVTVALPDLPAGPVIPNAAVRNRNGEPGVWQAEGGGLRFAPIRLGAGDLDGRVSVREGLAAGARVVVHSARSLTPRSRIRVVAQLPGVAP